MKKQLLLLSLSLLLASCGGPSASEPGSSQPTNDSDSSVQSTTTDPVSGSSNAELTKAEKLKALFASMAETGNCTITEDGVSTTEYFGGDKGALTIIDSSRLSNTASYVGYGVAKLNNYGLVNYYYVNDTDGVDASTTRIVSPNKSITFEEYDNSIKELGECGKLVAFAESSRTHTFSTTDADFLSALATLDGNSADFDSYTTCKATITLNDDATEMTVGYILDGSSSSSKITRQGLVFGSVGSTKNSKVESYLASNITLTAPTAWDQNTVSFFKSIDAGLNVPFPAGATYAATASLSKNQSGDGYILFKDLASGNIASAYGAALVGAGFAVDPENTGTDTGISVYGYKKTFSSSNPMEGAIDLTFLLVYQTGSTEELKKLYPNGIFVVYVFADVIPADVTADQLNNYLSTFKVDWDQTTNAFPTMSFGDNCTKIQFLDQTEATEQEYNDYFAGYAQFDFKIAATAYAYYATQAEAEAAKTAIASVLTAASFEEYNPTKYPGSYALTDPNNVSDWEIDVSLSVATKDSAYAGYLEISFSYLKFTQN